MKFHIAQEAFKPKTVSSLEEVLEGFDNLHPTKNAFYIIQRLGEEHALAVDYLQPGESIREKARTRHRLSERND